MLLITLIEYIRPGHSKKLYKQISRLDIRKNSFCLRVVDPWNSLPEKVVSAPSIDSFERRLDKFWQNQKILYDFTKPIKIYHSNNTPILNGTGSEDEDISNDPPDEFAASN